MVVGLMGKSMGSGVSSAWLKPQFNYMLTV